MTISALSLFSRALAFTAIDAYAISVIKRKITWAWEIIFFYCTDCKENFELTFNCVIVSPSFGENDACVIFGMNRNINFYCCNDSRKKAKYVKWDKKKSLGLAKFPPSRRHLKLLKLKRRWQNVSGQLKNRIETVEIWRWCWLFSHSSHRRLYNTCLSANRRQKKAFMGNENNKNINTSPPITKQQKNIHHFYE